ncbi:uncharacterized protein TNCV_2223651 [Trichonephila clavipes]|nr:uncharacterized protein TNCV_2223651 [Trichonephila clavipes]
MESVVAVCAGKNVTTGRLWNVCLAPCLFNRSLPVFEDYGPPRPLHQLCGQCGVEQCGGIVPLTRAPPHPYTVIICPKTNRDSSLNTAFSRSVTSHIDLAWHHCRHSCRCFCVKGSAQKGHLDLRFASARCLEIVCETIATPTSARIIERVTVGSTSACSTFLQSSFLVVFLVAPDQVFRA